jgi:hypothetical protein
MQDALNTSGPAVPYLYQFNGVGIAVIVVEKESPRLYKGRYLNGSKADVTIEKRRIGSVVYKSPEEAVARIKLVRESNIRVLERDLGLEKEKLATIEATLAMAKLIVRSDGG